MEPAVQTSAPRSERGWVAEWSCSGLQSRVRRFDSDPSLHFTLRRALSGQSRCHDGAPVRAIPALSRRPGCAIHRRALTVGLWKPARIAPRRLFGRESGTLPCGAATPYDARVDGPPEIRAVLKQSFGKIAVERTKNTNWGCRRAKSPASWVLPSRHSTARKRTRHETSFFKEAACRCGWPHAFRLYSRK